LKSILNGACLQIIKPLARDQFLCCGDKRVIDSVRALCRELMFDYNLG